jgi:hypothetical protein
VARRAAQRDAQRDDEMQRRIPKRPAAQQELKERVLDHIESKIRILQAAHACVSAARNAEAMAVCHAQERKQMKELRDRDRQGVKAGSP